MQPSVIGVKVRGPTERFIVAEELVDRAGPAVHGNEELAAFT